MKPSKVAKALRLVKGWSFFLGGRLEDHITHICFCSIFFLGGSEIKDQVIKF